MLMTLSCYNNRNQLKLCFHPMFSSCLMQVAACELLHSLVVYMVGKSTQMVEGQTSLPPMYKLHKRLFPVLLHLACDVDQVREKSLHFVGFWTT